MSSRIPGDEKLSGSRKTLQRGATYGRYLPNGYLVYVNRGTLFAVPFDPGTLDMRGTPVPMLAHVAYNPTIGSAQFAFSQTGTLLYRSGGATGGERFTVQWLDSQGKTQPLLAKPDDYLFPRLSPDGERLAISTSDVWVYDWRRDTLTRLTFGGGSAPLWSPDGRAIVFRKIGEGLFWTRSDGSGKPQPLTHSKGQQTPYSFSPDGKRLAFHEFAGDAGIHLWTMPLENDGAELRVGKPEIFLQTQFSERSPSFSSDGRWLAYYSDESGRYQVYVRAFPDKGGKWQVSTNGGAYPVFSRNGPELFYRDEDYRIMVVSYRVKDDSFVAENPRVWSETKIANLALNGASYDVAPDGKRIVALIPAETAETQQAQNQVIFLENFFDELRRRVPTGE